MNPSTWVWFLASAFLVYVVAIDPNVLTWLELQLKSATIQFQRQWFRIRHNPDSPWVRYEIKRNADKLAAEFIKERDNAGN